MMINKLKRELKRQRIRFAVFLRNDSNIEYFNSFSEVIMLVVPAAGNVFLVSSALERERAMKSSRIRSIVVLKYKNMKELVMAKLGRRIPGIVGINKLNVTLAQHKMLKRIFKGAVFKDISKICNNIRKQKTEQEISIIRKACSITDNILADFARKLGKFRDEKQAAMFLRERIVEKGCEPSFEPIVASSANSSMPHHEPLKMDKASQIKKGFCVVDFGVKYKGYCTDITRTFYIGNPSKKEIDDYYFVLMCQEKALRMIKPGVKFSAISNDIENDFKRYGSKQLHSLGHGIGIEIHESPIISAKSKDFVQKGMVIAIEPGLYFAGKYGIRIEDDVLIDSNGNAKFLTHFSKKLTIINKR